MNLDTYEQNKDRPAWVRRHRDKLQELAGLEIPRSLAGVETWLDGHQAHLTRNMREHFDPDRYGYDEPDSTEPTNGGEA